MSLPDRTLCWVEGPPWDRACDPVDELMTSDTKLTGFDEDKLRRRLADLDMEQMGDVLALFCLEVQSRGIDPVGLLHLAAERLER